MSDMSDEEGHSLEYNEDEQVTTTPSLYAVLGVRSDATPASIRKAFLTLSSAYHTDKHALQSDEVQGMMSSRFQQLTEAYEVLSDPRKRAAYDGSGKHWESRLELVPANHQSPADVRRYVDVLEAEAEAKRVSTLLSASSATSLEISVAHWFSGKAVQKKLVARRQQGNAADGPKLADEFKRPQTPETNEKPNNDQEPSTPEAVTSTAPAVASAPPSPIGQGDNTTPSTEAPTQPPTTPTTAPPATEGGVSTPPITGTPLGSNVQVAQMEVNGEMQFVAILPPHIQEQLKNSPQVQQSMGAGVGGAAMGGSSTAPKRGGLSALLLVHSLTGSYAFNHPLTPSSILSFKGECSHNRQGGSNAFVVSYTKMWERSKAGASVKASMKGLEYRFKWSRTLTALTNMAVNYNFKQLSTTLSRKLSAATTLVNTLTLTGADDGGTFSSSLQHAVSAAHHVVGEVTMGYGSLALSATHAFLPTPTIKVTQTVATQLLSGRTYLNYELLWLKSKLHHMGIGISTTLPCSLSPLGGLLWAEPSLAMNQISLLYVRGDHSISIPIVLCVSDKVSRALQVFGAPIALYGIGRVLVQPVMRMNHMKEVRRIRSEAAHEVDAARDRCKLEMLALHASISKRRAHEAGTDGLVITSASYGVLPRYATATPEEVLPTPSLPIVAKPDYPTLDVTNALQNLVHDSSLELAAGPKVHLPGFVDVDPGTGEKKRIRIAYTYQGLPHFVELPEDAPISLPQDAHQAPV